MENQRLAQLPVTEFLDRLASDAPTPGGGSVAALAGAMAAALGQMVSAFTLGRAKFAAVEPDVQALSRRLGHAAEMLRTLIDEDASAYELLSTAFKLDKSDPRRPERIRLAAGLAGAVPLETATLAARMIADLDRLREIGNPLLSSDVEAATHLARAALAAAAANVRANIPLMSDEEGQRIREQLEGLPAARP